MSTEQPTPMPAPVVAESPATATTAATAAAALGLRFLEPGTLHFARKGVVLSLTVDGDAAPYAKVTVLRAFPLSHPDRWWSVRNEKNEEIGVLAEPTQLPADQLELVLAEIGRRYMTSVVTLIVAVRERFGTQDWTVETERGPCTFTTRELRETLLHPSPQRYILTDVEGNRFDIPDLKSLPLASQALLQQHV